MRINGIVIVTYKITNSIICCSSCYIRTFAVNTFAGIYVLTGHNICETINLYSDPRLLIKTLHHRRPLQTDTHAVSYTHLDVYKRQS